MASAAQQTKSSSLPPPETKVSSGAAAVGAALGAVAGFIMPFPGAISLFATAGGVAGKLLGEKLAHEDDNSDLPETEEVKRSSKKSAARALK